MDDLLHSLCNVCVGLFFSSNFCIFFVNMSSKWESHAYLFSGFLVFVLFWFFYKAFLFLGAMCSECKLFQQIT